MAAALLHNGLATSFTEMTIILTIQRTSEHRSHANTVVTSNFTTSFGHIGINYLVTENERRGGTSTGF